MSVENASASQQPHRRFNPLKNEWLIVSPHRCNRPWSGQTEKTMDDVVPEFDPKNPLCPGVRRSSGKVNENYERTFVFENDFPALLPDSKWAPNDDGETHPLFQSSSIEGECRVMCFHRRSDLQLATMDLSDVRAVIECWQDQMKDLGPKYDWVQIFENKGAVMGCSNPHPHCQIWAGNFLPNEPKTKDVSQKIYYDREKTPMLMEYVREELKRKERIVVENERWLAVVPFWAVWPYETMILPKRHLLRITDVDDDEKQKLAEIMQKLLIKYDNLFKCTFPYSMAWHGAPTGKFLNENCDHWTLHAVYLPPLLRSSTVKKFMAGYEMVCEPQRDLTPEMAAETLRNLPSIHYKRSWSVFDAFYRRPPFLTFFRNKS